MKRRKYDALGSELAAHGGLRPERGPRRRGSDGDGPWGGAGYEFHFEGSGFSDFSENLFGGRTRREAEFHPFGPGDHGRPGAGPVPGQDIETDIMVTLHEAVQGAQRVITVQSPRAPGEAPRTRIVRFRIPSGVVEGQRIRLAGYGEPGRNGGRDGDLFLEVRLERHPDYRVQRHDLYYELQLAPWEAVLGAVVPVRSLYGKVPAALRRARHLSPAADQCPPKAPCQPAHDS